MFYSLPPSLPRTMTGTCTTLASWVSIYISDDVTDTALLIGGDAH